ncbi:MAG: T9SS type A sorting domain-containing protein [Saprospiraceae bacterium]|uniref:T9SS type A sorting domain-containing protein n=1 Tax=Candidatus Defluviibacterium haderslevense TaxID=2981993 RepID=A0A9D7SAQ9_9BACT|nr:T9SS type A sorting domain-containing protein [Candidatus Defluviibacterium haderslevense]
MNYNCLIDTSLNEIVFENSYQLKKDFRSINPKPKECYFEIENITDNFKGGYLINLKNYHSIQNKSTYIGVSAISECGDRNDYHNALNNTDSIYIWSLILPQKNTSRKDLKNYKYFSIHLKPNLTINSSNQFLENNSLNVYPNPANNYIVVDCKEAIEIFNSEGDLIFSVPSNEEKKILDLNLIESGVYIIKKIDSRGNVISQFKFSKF